ncbi:hypothetical protein BJ912DRAFT_930747 [Pholiota molesta]|nr:hypothetical protein BJ912DRAFT_930747 [Pholiota molesta]
MPSSSSSVAVRRSIRWVPGPATEPTDTVVLTGGKTGCSWTCVLEGGRRSAGLGVCWVSPSTSVRISFCDVSDGRVQFEHHIDSRTLDPLSVTDIGTNTVLDSGDTLETGEMVNPDTGLMTPYEEIWHEHPLRDPCPALFLCNASGSAWQAQVGDRQLAMGREGEGRFWAWQGVRNAAGGWDVLSSTGLSAGSWLFCRERESVWVGWGDESGVEWGCLEDFGVGMNLELTF